MFTARKKTFYEAVRIAGMYDGIATNIDTEFGLLHVVFTEDDYVSTINMFGTSAVWRSGLEGDGSGRIDICIPKIVRSSKFGGYRDYAISLVIASGLYLYLTGEQLTTEESDDFAKMIAKGFCRSIHGGESLRDGITEQFISGINDKSAISMISHAVEIYLNEIDEDISNAEYVANSIEEIKDDQSLLRSVYYAASYILGYTVDDDDNDGVGISIDWIRDQLKKRKNH